MTFFLNNIDEVNEFTLMAKDKYFVDKSKLIEKLNEVLGFKERYICITRPRRFGKSINAMMLATYYSKNLDAKNIFEKLKISQDSSYLEHLNKHNVIYISFNDQANEFETYDEYITYFEERLKKDLKEFYPELEEDKFLVDMFKEIYRKTKEGFIFIIDEWDYIFNRRLYTKDERRNFLVFLENLLKGRSYVELTYMTGILPIAKYSSGSSLNMFDEYTNIGDKTYGEYFGFTQKEVEELCKKQDEVTIEELQEWYNGYYSYKGERVYNPRSVVYALNRGECRSYWTNTGRKNEIADYINLNIAGIKEDIIAMMSGETIFTKLYGYDAESKELEPSKDLILSAMVILGFLSYHDGMLSIPNKEILMEFDNILTNTDIGGLTDIVQESKDMLEATIDKDIEKMEQIIENAHNKYMSYFEYNTENSLSCIITLVYLYARSTYTVKREDVSAKGRADFAFYPININRPAFIVELKKDDTPENAIAQIRERDYFSAFENYKGKKMLIGIVYDSKDKKHSVKIEEL